MKNLGVVSSRASGAHYAKLEVHFRRTGTRKRWSDLKKEFERASGPTPRPLPDLNDDDDPPSPAANKEEEPKGEETTALQTTEKRNQAVADKRKDNVNVDINPNGKKALEQEEGGVVEVVVEQGKPGGGRRRPTRPARP